MKSISPTILPALALLTLGGCAGTAGLTTTEPDGVYYSAKDRTEAVATAPAAAEVAATTPDDPDAVANPEYRSGQAAARGGSAEYYDDSYAYQPPRTYRGLGVSSYYAYDPFWYGPSPFAYSAFGYPLYGGYGYPLYGGFYDPFYGPAFGYGFGGPFVSIGIGWGSPWGFYRPYRYGYRAFGYDPYFGSGYGYGYTGWNGYRNGNRNVHYGPRSSRSSEAITQGRGANTGRGTVVDTGGRMLNNSGNTTAEAPTRRGRVVESGAPGTLPTGGTRSGRLQEVAPASQGVSSSSSAAEAADNNVGRGRLYRILDTDGSPQPTGGVRGTGQQPTQPISRPSVEYGNNRGEAAQPEYSQPQPQYQPQPQQEYRTRRQRSYESSPPAGQPQRTYEAPTRQRTYEAPVRQRTYEAPTRSYEAPARPAPSNPGGSFGSPRGGGRGRVN